MRYVIGMFVCVIILTLTSGAAFVLSVEGGGGFLLLLSIGCCALKYSLLHSHFQGNLSCWLRGRRVERYWRFRPCSSVAARKARRLETTEAE